MQQAPKGGANTADRGNPEIQERQNHPQFLPEKPR